MLLTWFTLFIHLMLPGNNPDERIAASLLSRGIAGESQSFILVLRDQADLSEVRLIRGKEAKGQAAFALL